MTQAILFDVDGTLIDTVDLHAACWVEALQRYGVQARLEDVRLQIGKGGDQLILGIMPPERVEREGEELQAFRSDLFKRDYLPRAKAFPGVRPLFERIRAEGQRIALASSGKADEVERYAELAGIADLIDAATTSDDAERSKPFPDIFSAALARLEGIAPQDAVVVGDTPYDAEAARGAGIRSIGVLCGGFPERALREAGCMAVYAGPEDLLAGYEGSPLSRSPGSET